jgi:hypothetical protein
MGLEQRVKSVETKSRSAKENCRGSQKKTADRKSIENWKVAVLN